MTERSDMETGSIVTALVREYTAETTRNMAIYCIRSRISIRGHSYLIETRDDDDYDNSDDEFEDDDEIKEHKYRPTAAFKDRDAVVFLICEAAKQHCLFRTNINIELGNKISSVFDVRNTLRCNSSQHMADDDRIHNEEIINKFLTILESETAIRL